MQPRFSDVLAPKYPNLNDGNTGFLCFIVADYSMPNEQSSDCVKDLGSRSKIIIIFESLLTIFEAINCLEPKTKLPLPSLTKLSLSESLTHSVLVSK